MAAPRTGAARRTAAYPAERGVWTRSRRVQHCVASRHLRNRPKVGVNADAAILGSSRPIGFCRLVDGRRVHDQPVHPRLHDERERANGRMAAGALGSDGVRGLGPASAEAVHPATAAARDEHASDRSSSCDPLSLVQVRPSPSGLTLRGTVVAVRRTGRVVETYDIGVADNHNFFADGVLIHNCQHLAADSCTHLHNVVQPTLSIGLTAAPFRVDRMRLCYQKIIKDAGIHQLIQLGYLAKYWLYVVPRWTPRPELVVPAGPVLAPRQKPGFFEKPGFCARRAAPAGQTREASEELKHVAGGRPSLAAASARRPCRLIAHTSGSRSL
jgi:hypothetical protein